MDINVDYLGVVAKTHKARISFDLAHRYTVPYENIPVRVDGQYEIDGQTVTMTAQERRMYFHALYEDNWKKDFPELVIRDQTRDVQELSAVERAIQSEEGIIAYDCLISWTVHARVELVVEISFDQLTEEMSAAIAEAGERIANEWIAYRPFTPLP
jgi:hypothetical protein